MLDSLKTASTTLRKFNCFLVVSANSWGAMTSILGREDAETFMNNAGAVLWMSTKDVAGAEALSKLLGETEIHTENKSIGVPMKNLGAENEVRQVNVSYAQQSRRLMLPYEIRTKLGPDDQIILMDGVARPILGKKRPYYKTKYRYLGRRNPYAT